MTEQVVGTTPEGDQADPEEPVPGDPMRTGMPEVDDVISEVEGLDEVPLTEHVDTFQRADETLRGALDGREAAPEQPDESV